MLLQKFRKSFLSQNASLLYYAFSVTLITIIFIRTFANALLQIYGTRSRLTGLELHAPSTQKKVFVNTTRVATLRSPFSIPHTSVVIFTQTTELRFPEILTAWIVWTTNIAIGGKESTLTLHHLTITYPPYGFTTIKSLCCYVSILSTNLKTINTTRRPFYKKF